MLEFMLKSMSYANQQSPNNNHNFEFLSLLNLVVSIGRPQQAAKTQIFSYILIRWMLLNFHFHAMPHLHTMPTGDTFWDAWIIMIMMYVIFMELFGPLFAEFIISIISIIVMVIVI